MVGESMYETAWNLFLALSLEEQVTFVKAANKQVRPATQVRRMEPVALTAQCATCNSHFDYIRTGRGAPRKHCQECRPALVKVG